MVRELERRADGRGQAGTSAQPVRVPENPASAQGHPCGIRRKPECSLARRARERQEKAPLTGHWGNLPVPPDPSTGPLRGRTLRAYFTSTVAPASSSWALIESASSWAT